LIVGLQARVTACLQFFLSKSIDGIWGGPWSVWGCLCVFILFSVFQPHLRLKKVIKGLWPWFLPL